MNTFKWLLKREFWEHKGGFLWLPIVVGALMIAFTVVSLGIAVSGVKSGMEINGVAVSSFADIVTPEKRALFASAIVANYTKLATPIMIAFGFCVFFFCLGALHDERKDRSVLFWKSLPISDAETVLSKVAMAIGVAPLIALAAATITAIITGLLICGASAMAGVNIFAEVLSNPATYLAPLQLVAMLPIYALWALPAIGWLLMVSAWARGKPLLWAIGVPVLAGALLSWANAMFRFDWNMPWFWQNIVGRLLGSILPGAWFSQQGQGLPGPGDTPTSGILGPALSQSWLLLADANIWIGAAAGAAMIYVAIRLRGWREEG